MRRKSLELFSHATPELEHAFNAQSILGMLADKRPQGPLDFRWHCGLPLAILALCSIFSGVVYLIAAVCETNQRWLREEQNWVRRDAVRAFVITAALVVSFLGIVTLCFGFSWIR